VPLAGVPAGPSRARTLGAAVPDTTTPAPGRPGPGGARRDPHAGGQSRHGACSSPAGPRRWI